MVENVTLFLLALDVVYAMVYWLNAWHLLWHLFINIMVMLRDRIWYNAKSK